MRSSQRHVSGSVCRRAFALDLRSLAVMRIAVGLTVATDLLVRVVHTAEHYSDRGVLPRGDAAGLDPFAAISALAPTGSAVWAGAVFAVALTLCAAMIVGWRTRLTTCLLWLCVISIQHRNPLVNDHRDALISCVLIWGALLPWGRALSLDARRSPPAAAAYCGLSGAGYVLQIACLYLMAALLKSGAEWRTAHTAVHYALSVDYWTLPLGTALLDYPRWTATLTFLTLWFEFAVGVAVVSPWRTTALRGFAILGAAAMHIGFGLCIWLGTFPMISIAAMLGLLPAKFWELPGVRRIGQPRRDAGPVVERRPIRYLAGMAIAYAILLNVLSLPGAGDHRVARAVAAPAALLGFSQNWNMFAPSPPRLDGWFVVAGTLTSGESVDLLASGQPVSWRRPQSFHARFRTTRELVYFRRLLTAGKIPLARYAAYRCRVGAGHRTLPIASVAVYFIAERSAPPGYPSVRLGRQRLIDFPCPY